MIDIPSGRIEKTAALTIGETGGKLRSRFVFSDLEQLDPEGRYKVIIHNRLPRGVSIPVRVSGAVESVNFHLRSFQKRFGIQNLNEKTLFESVLRAKAGLLKKREADNSEFILLTGLLYEGPERSLSNPSETALKAITEYSGWAKKAVRLSAKRFGLQNSLIIQGNWVATDVKKTLKAGKTKVKMARLPSGQEIVRRIFDPDFRHMDTVARFRNAPHVIPTLATARYVNSKGRDVFVSYHPFFEKTLHQFVVQNQSLPYDTQVQIIGQILAGMEAINKEGIHGNLLLGKIFTSTEQGKIELFIAGLEKFIPHGELDELIKADWSAPEVLNAEIAPPPDEKQDVWQLGIIFQTLFQKKIESISFFSRTSQDHIDAHIRDKEFPPPIATMIQGMLQVDPVKRWNFQEVIHHFKQDVLEDFGRLINPLRKSPIDASAVVALHTYAKACEKTIHFSAAYFQLKHSATATPDLSVVDLGNSLIAQNGTKIKLALLPTGKKIVRRIDEYCPRMVKILNLFLNTPHVLPTLGMARYTNKKGRNILVSYHPLFDMDLRKPLILRDQSLTYETQVDICRQIILGMEEVHKKGIHGDLYLRNILINTDRHVVISDLEMFQPHDTSEQWELPIQADWSAPEVRSVKQPPRAAAIQDVWSLGLIFHALFQRKNRQERYFRWSSQDEIHADIVARDFPHPVARMIYSMLQIDPIKRSSLQRISQYFQQNILSSGKSATTSNTSAEVASS